ncbi:probable amidase At4g34880 [Selaginella moellendorffii]|uniref:probable amidase At4g34880 n=1 Tax=Selaginella moellendorffii TaxID=88036 RepID=UPI000D1C7D97|nr:probable amidase At4g34880 [Selaginella moellendorffii]|eukprot:XP_024544986.1 probable amidase At4g34880 [Selaginella moellendorffii]
MLTRRNQTSRDSQRSIVLFQEKSIAEIHHEFARGLTSRKLVELYIERVRRHDPQLKSIIELNPDVWKLADQADAERSAAGGYVGGLHGIPILLKDNIATADSLSTTAGSFALFPNTVKDEAFVVSLLRKAGAIIFGKANLSELMHFRSQLLPNGFSPRGNQTKDPYSLDSDPCGSSTGSAVAVAANLVSVSLGTETQGSLICPSSRNAVVSIKPTVGLTSRSGVIPISINFDTIGPMAKTVADAVLTLDKIVGSDPKDKATFACKLPDYGFHSHLKADGLCGKRIAISRSPFFDEVPSFEVAVINNAIATMKKKGAVIIDNVTIPTIGEIINGTALFPPPLKADVVTLLTDFKIQIEEYLGGLLETPVKNLQDIFDFDRFSQPEEFAKFPDDIFNASLQTQGRDTAAYQLALATDFNLTRDGLLKIFQELQLDAIVAPADSSIAVPASIGGFPAITLPAGYSPLNGLPYGITIVGNRCSEAKLVEIAFALEQETKARKPPPLFA